MTVKSKIRLGLMFLLAIIILLSASGSYYINKLARESKDILKDNYNTLQYTKLMIEAMDNHDSTLAIKIFEDNLVLQEHNITEPGEFEATQEIRTLFTLYKNGERDENTKVRLRAKILAVQSLNMKAIVAKNAVITQKTQTAFGYIAMLGTLCFLLSFTFVINFPRWIAGPIAKLAEGIKGISKKEYNTRIQLHTKDEFGELAGAFNQMAEELDAWQHSNVSQLMFEKSRIEAVINNMQDAVIGFDAKGNILFVNMVAEELMSLKKSDIVGKYAADIALKNDLLRTLLNKNEIKELKIYANKKESYFTRNYAQVLNGNEVIGEVFVLHNITPFKELDAAKTNFIATVSHELKTPIAAIKMSLQLLRSDKDSQLSAQQSQLVEGMEEDTNRLLKIIAELLNMAQLETGNIQLNMSNVSPFEIVKLALEAVKPLAESKQIEIESNFTPDVSQVHADSDKTVWVIVNLLTNAIRHSYENGKIVVSISGLDNKVLVSVKDNGIGIEQKYLPRLFERYFKVPGSKGGTGLGLSICKEFIEAEDGEIWVESDLGMGSTFYITLKKSTDDAMYLKE
jgi:PAS domain S-box-containing protein